MKTIERGQLLDQLNWRYATKQFDAGKKLSADDLEALESVLNLSPSSYGLQPWKFVVVEDPEVRAKLREVSWGQPQITDASQLIVLAAKKEFTEADIDAHLERTAEVNGVPVENLAAFRGMMVGGVIQAKTPEERAEWTKRQVYIPLGSLLTSAALMGIDACPMEGFDAAAYDEILGLGKLGYGSVALAAVGYRSAEDKYASAPKVRFPKEQVFLRI